MSVCKKIFSKFLFFFPIERSSVYTERANTADAEESKVKLFTLSNQL